MVILFPVAAAKKNRMVGNAHMQQGHRVPNPLFFYLIK
jgi:hypothetical protein